MQALSKRTRKKARADRLMELVKECDTWNEAVAKLMAEEADRVRNRHYLTRQTADGRRRRARSMNERHQAYRAKDGLEEARLSVAVLERPLRHETNGELSEQGVPFLAPEERIAELKYT